MKLLVMLEVDHPDLTAEQLMAQMAQPIKYLGDGCEAAVYASSPERARGESRVCYQIAAGASGPPIDLARLLTALSAPSAPPPTEAEDIVDPPGAGPESTEGGAA